MKTAGWWGLLALVPFGGGSLEDVGCRVVGKSGRVLRIETCFASRMESVVDPLKVLRKVNITHRLI